MYCLDTNIIVAILRGDKDLRIKLDSKNPEELCITSVSLCELFQGVYKTKNTAKTLLELESLIKNFGVLDLDSKSARIFGMDFSKLEKSGKPTQTLDLLTASVAKRNDVTIITRNTKHFQNIPDLRMEEW